jgi:hypothetical protein
LIIIFKGLTGLLTKSNIGPDKYKTKWLMAVT